VSGALIVARVLQRKEDEPPVIFVCARAHPSASCAFSADMSAEAVREIIANLQEALDELEGKRAGSTTESLLAWLRLNPPGPTVQEDDGA
jgi:hypothetical protein